MNNDEFYMKIAINEAKKAYNRGEVPVGAVIVKENRVISKAYNTKNKKNCVINHAEILAIKKASKKLKNWRLNDCTMYITLYPCSMCASAINQSRISKIVIGADNNSINHNIVDKILFDKSNGTDIVIVNNILKNDCGKLLKQFFLKKR